MNRTRNVSAGGGKLHTPQELSSRDSLSKVNPNTQVVNSAGPNREIGRSPYRVFFTCVSEQQVGADPADTID